MIRLIGLVVAVIVAAGTERASAQNVGSMNAWEQGSYYIVSMYTDAMLNDLSAYENAARITLEHRQNQRGQDHSDDTSAKACQLVRRWINLHRSLLDVQAKQPIKYRLTVADSIAGYHRAMIDVFDIVDKYKYQTRCEQLSGAIHQEVIAGTVRVRSEKQSLLELIAGRGGAGISWSNNFSVELAPLPFKVEFLEGSLKLKLSASAGPLKFDFQSGPKLQQHQPPAGLKLLVLMTPDQRMRAFDIEGQRMDFSIPFSRIRILGSTLAVECTQSCLDEIK